MPRHHNDILGKIKKASTPGEIDALLAEAEMFKDISDKTRRRHKRFADRRKMELEDGEK